MIQSSRIVLFLAFLLALCQFGPAATTQPASFPPDWTAPPDGPIPIVKHFPDGWIDSLTQTGTPKVYTKSNSHNFDYIGMPVGGIGCGELYLGGDGKLWRWDIFNAEFPDQIFYENGSEYEHPPLEGDAVPPINGLRQGFAIQVGDDAPHTLDRNGFADIQFAGHYPVAEINYRDPAVPIEAHLQAFSPFIPLDVARSTFPATILRYTFHNTAAKPAHCRFGGWMENANAWKTRTVAPGSLVNQAIAVGSHPALLLSATPGTAYRKMSDVGTQCLLLLPDDPATVVSVRPGSSADPSVALAEASAASDGNSATVPFAIAARNGGPIGSVRAAFDLAPGQSRTLTCLLAWHNPNNTNMPVSTDRRRANAKQFKDAADVAATVAAQLDSLVRDTLLWRDTWNDSTLPAWFLDRTFANASTLASATFFQFADGRFYGNEGIYSCQGTCTHVYSYAQAIAYLFPTIERDIRHRVDLTLALNPQTGVILSRGEGAGEFAVDGQCGTILRCYREHLLCPNDDFLKSNWPQIKKAFDPLFALDPHKEGLLDGPQHNTLDANWYGHISWISGLYVAALRAGEAMANICGDPAFAAECHQRAQAGSKALPDHCFHHGYFTAEVDPAHLDTTNSGLGCEIDQVFGQCWASQLDLPRVFDRDQTLSALRALWRNNFTTDVGPYRQASRRGRNYALAGEAGLIMATFPHDDWTFAQASGNGKGAFPGYFNECMSGFEYQVAAHMIREGLTLQGLSIARAIDDRYDGAKRNPWNEVECGSHYARAMASYGVFLAACGYHADAPARSLEFSPALTPENFRAPFTTATGWGTYSQQSTPTSLTATIELKFGSLDLSTLKLHLLTPPTTATATLSTKSPATEPTDTHLTQNTDSTTLTFPQPIHLTSGNSLQLVLK
jgi:uncharacterized protein (DUF608 family)